MIKLRVNGDPLPTPKKELNRKTGALYPRDYRTRKHPVTGKIQKYDRGYKERWFQKVKLEVHDYMRKNDISIIMKSESSVMFDAFFYLEKPKSSKYDSHVVKPDLTNLYYRLENVLQGIAYEDDSQITCVFLTKDWATKDKPAGVEIHIQRS